MIDHFCVNGLSAWTSAAHDEGMTPLEIDAAAYRRHG
ncbi:hypothetical protein HD596_010125 [Nonomuraea jabiensis]|uniref:Uncharacterized protein n=1 Tax=Nonomuraea jabiensis TaxID=882448 RepID=A0A7W9GGH4_9ACTN|nr:hypothetical protein [Nonomuraea jabiensis]